MIQVVFICAILPYAVDKITVYLANSVLKNREWLYFHFFVMFTINILF